MALNVGRVLEGKYRVLRLIGEGGMGSIFEAEHVVLGKKYAVKIMNPTYATKETAVERFIREARAASAIGHPNIVEIFDVVREDEETVFIVMELLKGQTLEALIDKLTVVPVERTVSIILQVLSALNAAHHKNIIHRDLKPDNIFLSFNQRGMEEIKLLDFGIAKFRGEDEQDLNLTSPGIILGTPKYIAPELIRGKVEPDNRADLWAVGIILYQMSTGKVPYPGETFQEVFSKILTEDHIPVQNIATHLPPKLYQIIEKALEKNRDIRYSSASEMMQDLINLKGSAISLMSTASQKAVQNSLIPPPSDAESSKHPTGGPPHLDIVDHAPVFDDQPTSETNRVDIPQAANGSDHSPLPKQKPIDDLKINTPAEENISEDATKNGSSGKFKKAQNLKRIYFSHKPLIIAGGVILIGLLLIIPALLLLTNRQNQTVNLSKGETHVPSQKSPQISSPDNTQIHTTQPAEPIPSQNAAELTIIRPRKSTDEEPEHHTDDNMDSTKQTGNDGLASPLDAPSADSPGKIEAPSDQGTVRSGQTDTDTASVLLDKKTIKKKKRSKKQKQKKRKKNNVLLDSPF